MDNNIQQPSALRRLLVQIWPTINRITTTTFYFLLNVIRGVVKRSIAQLKGQM